MIIADAIGILAGIVLQKRIPTHVVKWVAAVTFATFGMLGMHESLDLVLPKDVTVHHVCLLAVLPALAWLMVLIARPSTYSAQHQV
jgi:small basic protein